MKALTINDKKPMLIVTHN